MFSTFFKSAGWPGILFTTLLVLFTGCSKDEDAPSAASLAEPFVNCNTTSNRLILQGSSGVSFEAVITLDDNGDDTTDGNESGAWCSFESNTSVANGSVGREVPLLLETNTSGKYRAARIQVTYTDGYSTTLILWQMPASPDPQFQRPWGEQPVYRAGADYIYKTYFTSLLSTNKYLMGGRRRNFSICFDSRYRVSLWVAYPLHGCYTSPRAGRSDAWAYDPNNQLPEIAESQQAYIIDSYGSGAARGHQCPSADRYNTAATNEMTFYSTNIMPQNYAFNGGSWKKLEEKIRDWAPTTVTSMRYDTLFVVTGAHLTGATFSDRKGKQVGNPDKCWKVLLKQKRGLNKNRQIWEFSADELQAIGFIFPNNASSKDMKLRDAACTVAEVERLTGFTFFANLDPEVAEELRNREPDATQWPGLSTL